MMKRAHTAKTSNAAIKLTPTQIASFPSRAAIQIKPARVMKAMSTTHMVDIVTNSNSLRIRRIGDTCAKPNKGGPAKANNKTQVKRMLHNKGCADMVGNPVSNKLPSKRVKSS